ncbi:MULTISPECIES: transglycosylase SLT domain-containing protein [unclassified Coleofasciculus]|uniref:lytic transglycosylase domain-containing protein n=1 Tax=unclassified Coleofasciculus TaxID=2692782 RepID=UPI001880AB62|nr:MULTISPECIES: transglycosylase SLT domain-containing protein [unclassified Coleofasciculus]MBE9126511.1 transglycosylase SLT domain-containing protein [Coleofasciculus sp. LEGE 07081]MBE9149892.1 transglycosylase SLT domain-containing protein [Coleofasciculus sp. LEGE 07092]
MLKVRKHTIPVAVGAGLLVFTLLGSSLLMIKKTGLLEKWIGGETTQNLLSPTEKDAKSAVLPLVSLSPEARAAKLEEIASGGKSFDQHRARYLLASDLIQQQQGEAALKWLEGLETDYPILASQVALKRAQAYEVMGDTAKAQQAWQDILTTYPNEPAAAQALYVLGKSNPEYWNQAIAQFPSHPSTQEIIRQRLKENPKQLNLLLILAKYTPDTPDTGAIRDRLVNEYASQLKSEDWEAIAFGYWETWEYGKAGKAYAKAPRTPRNAYRAGRGYHLQGQRTEAKAAYQQLIREFPDAKETGLGLRRLASLLPSKEALPYLDLVISKFPDEAAEALLTKAEILDAVGSSKSAAEARQSVLTQYASSDTAAEYRWKIAKAKAAEGKSVEAWQWAQPITIDSPDSPLAPEAAFWVGRWATKLGRQKEAKESFEHVLAQYPESYYAWRSALLLGWDVGDFTTVRNMNPSVVQPPTRAVLPAGSDTLKELHKLGQKRDAWAVWQTEFQNRQEPTVTEQFTDGLIRLGIGENLKGINQVWNLSLRDTPEEREQWQALRSEPAYWYTLFPLPFQEQIVNWSGQRQLNPLLVAGLIRQESRFEPEIRSVAGATGLMQVMPGTGEWIAEKISLKDYNLKNPDDNVKLGTWYLDHTHQEYSNHSLLAVASYNAGPGNVAKWVRQYGFTDPDAFIEKIPFPETKGYVEAVFENYWNYLRLYNPEVAELLRKYSTAQPVIPQ